MGFLLISCASVQERLALRECTFTLVEVSVYDYQYDRMKLDFVIRAKNPNNVNAVLDRFTYTMYVNEKDIFSGETNKQVTISAGKSTNFTTTVTLEYAKLGTALIEAMQFEKAQYNLKAQAHVATVLGDITYPISIIFPEP